MNTKIFTLLNKIKNFNMKRVIFICALFTIFNNYSNAQQCFFKQVSSKSAHSLGITLDGKLYAWGSNAQGQLGLGTQISELIPKLVNQDSDWKKVETGQSSYFSIGLKNNGSLMFWGGNVYAINNQPSLTPVEIAKNFKWKDFSTGHFNILAIRDDNTLWGWGQNIDGSLGIDVESVGSQISTPTQVGIDNDWSEISCGVNHTLALKSNGTLWACGANNVGQLGNGTSENGIFSDAFVQVGTDNDWIEILACAGFNLAIKSNGTLWAWGSNGIGQLGDGTMINRLVPIQIGTDTDWKSIGYSGYSSAAIKTNGTLWTWGLGGQGQLGNGSNTSSLLPIQIGTDSNYISVTGGGGLGFAGTTGDHYLALKQDNELFSWGFNQGGSLGNNTTTNVNVPTSICKTIEIPSCTNILSPLNGQQNIENSATVIWNPVPAATGYKLTVKDGNGSIILTEDVGNVSQYLLNNLPPNTDICVSVNPYIVSGYENTDCDVICFKTKNVVPNCTTITSPTHGQTNAATNISITWQPTTNVQGYRITVKTPTTTIIDKMDVGNVNLYSVSNLPNNTLICVEVIPYNEVGESINCSTICFTTKNVVPNCTIITSPAQGETNTPTDITISWQPTTNVQGYRITVKTPTATIVEKMDVGNVNVYSVSNLPNNTLICVEVIPYNEVGESINCSTICFTTKMLSSVNEIISKNIHIYPNPSSESITITLPDDLQVSNATLYNTIGEQVNQYIPSSTTLIIEKQTKPAGIYYLKLTTNEGIVTKPIVFLE
jgi:alpha-tubulin suppressor-like RCC1 family protein